MVRSAVQILFILSVILGVSCDDSLDCALKLNHPVHSQDRDEAVAWLARIAGLQDCRMKGLQDCRSTYSSVAQSRSVPVFGACVPLISLQREDPLFCSKVLFSELIAKDSVALPMKDMVVILTNYG